MSPKRDPARGRAVLSGRTGTDAAPIGTTARRTQPSRLTVDLSLAERRRLGTWAAQAAEELDAPRVELAVIARVLFELLAEDQRVSDAALSRLRDRLQ